jgi:hypothetical protein
VGQIKKSRSLEAYFKRGQGPPWAVELSGMKGEIRRKYVKLFEYLNM